MPTEVHTLTEFDEALNREHGLRGVFVQSLDLTGRESELRHADVEGAVLLGCVLSDDVVDDVRRRGARVFPRLPEAPVNAYRSRLYAASELYDATAYADTTDARTYAWTRRWQSPPGLEHTLVAALHDHAMADALDEFLDAREAASIVGIMGGHALRRDEPAYEATARLGMALAQADRLVVSGGGPGAMEAANLGARLAPHGWQAIEEALNILAPVPSFRPSIDAWVGAALTVRSTFAGGADTLGIPTWFYGHEPPNLFATHIAKYFSNALREDTLLHRCRGGLVYLPGAAGTVQELFQAVTANYYAGDDEPITPLVLVGIEQWTTRLPAWTLLQHLANGRRMADHIALVDSVDEALDLLT